MITMKDYLGNNLISEVPLGHQRNAEEIIRKANLFLEKAGIKSSSNSGYRGLQHHIDIYRTKALREKRTFSMLQVPMKSKHLTGQAIDLNDPDGKLMLFAKQNVHIAEEIGLWFEEGTRGWLHAQTVPPASGKRFFYP